MILLVIAGAPGTGKSFLARKILNQYPSFVYLQPDQYKERYWDLYGFCNFEEKQYVTELAWQNFFTDLEEAMNQNQLILTEYPFSKQKEKLKDMVHRNSNYQILCIQLIAESHILYKRYYQRGFNLNRHIGHIANCYHIEQKVDCAKDCYLLSYDEFVYQNKKKQYDSFDIGMILKIDTSNFYYLDLSEVFTFIKDNMK